MQLGCVTQVLLVQHKVRDSTMTKVVCSAGQQPGEWGSLCAAYTKQASSASEVNQIPANATQPPVARNQSRSSYHRGRVHAAILSAHQRGCFPSSDGRRPRSEEAYALLWHSSAPSSRNSAFSGLAVLLHSIRQVDTQREIVLLTINSTMPSPAADSSLVALQRAFAPMSMQPLPEINVAHMRESCARKLRAMASRTKPGDPTSAYLLDRPRQQMQMFTKYGSERQSCQILTSCE